MHDDEGPRRGRDEGPRRARSVDDAVLRASEQFDDAVELLGLTNRKLKRGEIAGVKDVAPQIALVIRTLVALGEARGKIDDLAKHEACAGGHALDLDAARLEIRGRLDRLRAVHGP